MDLRWLFMLTCMLCSSFCHADEPASNTTSKQDSQRASVDEIKELKATVESLTRRLDQFTGQSSLNESQEQSPFHFQWNYGLQVRSWDDQFKMHLGGNVQIDTGWNTADPAVQYGSNGIGNLQDGSVFRRARVRVDGTMYRHIDWVTEFDFANSVENDTSSSTQTIGTPSFTNVWLGVNQLPYLGTLRGGWMNEPLGMENNTSNRWLPFLERMPANPLFSSPGILMLNNSENERMTWAAGVFHAQDNNFGFGYGDGQYAYTGRFTCLPWYECDGEQLIHLGMGVSHRHLDSGQIKLSGRPSVRTMPSTNLPSLANTGTILGVTEDIVDFECAAVWGPWTFQSEYFGRWIHDAVYPSTNGIPLGTLFYQGAYFEALFFLTGEHQPYDRKDGTFSRVIPLRNFNLQEGEHGWGAWQIGVRYAYLDLQNKGVNGATLNDLTFGLNWFLNPQAKLQWNLAIDHRESTPPGSDGWTYIFGMRLALDY